jgi:hypothetical protein
VALDLERQPLVLDLGLRGVESADGGWRLAGFDFGHVISVMAGLAPAIHVFVGGQFKDVDARHKAGHDDSKERSAEAAPE